MMEINYFFCEMCDHSEAHFSFCAFFAHVRSVHARQPGFRLRCVLASTCGSIYSTFESYRSHINRYHTNVFDYSLFPITNDQTFSNAPVDSAVQEGDHVDQFTVDVFNDSDQEDEFCVNDDLSENIWKPIHLSAACDFEKNTHFDYSHFEKQYVKFLLELREGHILPQKIVQSISEYFISFLKILDGIVEAKSLLNGPMSLQIFRDIISQLINTVGSTTKNEYQFLKLCEKHFDYSPPNEIILNDENNYVAYHIPLTKSVTQLLSKCDVLQLLVDNYNDNINKAAAEPDLIFSYRQGSLAQQHTVLKQHPDALLLQLYSDGIAVTNPIGAKKDAHKVTSVYYLIDDLAECYRSQVQSIGLVALANTKHLYDSTNRSIFYKKIIDDLNELQTAGLTLPTFNGRMYFAFTAMCADNLAANELGGFQKNFNSGYFCRSCLVSYQHRFISLIDQTFARRTVSTHNALVEKIEQNNDGSIIQGVSGRSPLADLYNYHPVESLPHDIMHDFAEGKLYFSFNCLIVVNVCFSLIP
jgi:hypothetical protein